MRMRSLLVREHMRINLWEVKRIVELKYLERMEKNLQPLSEREI